MELIQDIVFWKDHQAVILKKIFSSITEPIQVKLDIFLLWKNLSFNHLLIDDCITFVLACVSFHWLADKYKVNSNLSAKKYSKGYI